MDHGVRAFWPVVVLRKQCDAESIARGLVPHICVILLPHLRDFTQVNIYMQKGGSNPGMYCTLELFHEIFTMDAFVSPL